ncbi:MAG: NAD(P)-dependent alcohol dehydrogenase [Acidimicrobiia bacterium]
MSRTTTPTATMHAIVRRTYGGPDTLTYETVARPAIDDDEVLVEVHAAGLDRGVAHGMRGTPYVGRLSFGLRAPRRPVIGLDVSGVVVAVGARVSRFQPGDEVYGIAKGSFAEYAAAPESKLVHKPTGLSHLEAAVVPVSGLTSLQATRAAGVSPGRKVAVLGASGGVGTFLIQTAKAAGAEVTATSSAAKADLVVSLGADHVLDYAAGELDTMAGRFDAILFVAGTQSVSQLRRLLTRRGRLVVIGADQGRWLGIGRQIRATLLSPFVPQKLSMLVSRETHVDIEALSAMIEQGALRPHVGAVYPLAQAADAIRHLEAGQARGKIVIQVRP